MAGGRPKGTPNKRSQMLLKKLENEHNFFVVKKIVELYNEIDEMARPLVERAIENVQNGLSPTAGFTENNVEMLNGSQKNRWSILEKLLAYCYPKLKSMEVATGSGDHVSFNINIPAGTKIERAA